MRLNQLFWRCVVWVIADCAVPEMGFVSTRSSAGRFFELEVSLISLLAGVVGIASNAY